ncbi:MAG: methionyl-tRNA formyltransferase [Chitinophagales bacterium]|nr:methionyl-tRNA formyltransferase [Chitinophagales bacterium]HMV13789.1 methionyl-tRNA formyltransferase [Chitinophagales bacterium]HMW12168.1 methionyl-tRNA formyltransferase [Chitinophagales bacterium]HMX59301.1 methionyl-tRNA formyltransferase [Chitinophagales bacterium]HMY24071.1 methionyl-tRNA formyltransferase [Chitinophagales bacterium]
MKKQLRIVFMGTPDFAVPSLAALLDNKYQVVGVITAPDKPAGRGQQIQQSAVKKYALENELNILQPEKLKSPDFINELQNLNANLFIVVAFRMLPEIIWQMPTFGTFNLHASLLPQYRGAAPINWAVINGENETGVTTFFLQHEIDTGNIIFQEKIKIEATDNAGNVHDKLMHVGSSLVLKTVKAIEEDTVIQQTQSSIESGFLRHAPKIYKETCLIDWNKSVTEIHNLIRGLSPFPTAFTYIDGKVLKIFEARQFNNEITETIDVESKNDLQISIITNNKTYLAIKCSDGFLELLTVQLEGKKRMSIEEFLRGYKFIS